MHPTDRRTVQTGSLAERLFRLRKDAKMNQGELAGRLGWGRTKVTKIETGAQRPSKQDIRDWAAALDRPDVADELLELLADVEAVHKTWRSQLRGGGAAVQDDYDRRVREAKVIRAVSPLVVPGLLQTAGYARAVLTAVAETSGPLNVDATVEARMRRQEALYEPSRAFEFVTTEAALRMFPCPPQVMAGQLDRLMSLDLDNVTLGIIPLGTQLPVVPQNNFLLADDTAIVEGHGGSDTLGEQESAVYAHVFERLMGVAVTGDEARRLIAEAAATLREDRP